MSFPTIRTPQGPRVTSLRTTAQHTGRPPAEWPPRREAARPWRLQHAVVGGRLLSALAALAALACSDASEPTSESTVVESATSQSHTAQSFEAELGKLASPVVFGAVDRSEYGEIQSPVERSWADATAGLFLEQSIDCPAGSSQCTILTEPLGPQTIGGPHAPIKEASLCSFESGAGQQKAASCTAFLIREDLAVTAGHCIQNQYDCRTQKVAFGFVADESHPEGITSIPRDDVYGCARLLAHSGYPNAEEDWALIALDRAVDDRQPLSLSQSGTAAVGTPLVAFGHSKGLPLKRVNNASVIAHDGPSYETDLDITFGNSGGPVLNVDTGQVEGIAVAGPPGMEFSRSTEADGTVCAKYASCNAERGCVGTHKWSSVQRIGSVLNILSCADGLKNSSESDVDCGGSSDCEPCDRDRQCAHAGDCLSNFCNDGVCANRMSREASCIARTCWDGECEVDDSACECQSSSQCDDGDDCTRDLCFVSTRACIHIPESCG